MRIARFRSVYQKKSLEILYEPQLMWLRGHVFVLRGFERKATEQSRVMSQSPPRSSLRAL